MFNICIQISLHDKDLSLQTGYQAVKDNWLVDSQKLVINKKKWCRAPSPSKKLQQLKHGRKICQKLYRWGVGENGHPMSCMSCSRRFDLNMCSVNQLNAKTKLTEMWKTVNLPNHNLVIKKSELKNGMRSSRSITGGKLIEEALSTLKIATLCSVPKRPLKLLS